MAEQERSSTAVLGAGNKLGRRRHAAHDGIGEFANSVNGSKGRGWNSLTGDDFNFTDHLHSQKRISAEFEEVIVDPDVGAAEQPLPNLQNWKVKRIYRRGNVSDTISRSFRQLASQGFSGGSFRKFRHYGHMLRDLE